MIKRGCFFALVFILLATSVLGYHVAIGAYTFGTLPDFNISDGITPVQKPKITAFEDDLDVYAQPDLVVTNINLPDELPENSIIGPGWTVEIKNIGAGKAEGQINVRAELFSKQISRCVFDVYAGGSYGEKNPAYMNLMKMLRFTRLFPGQTLEVPIYDKLGRASEAPADSGCLGRVMNNDITIKITVNPIGGGGIEPKGRIEESDMTNNILTKTIKIVSADKMKNIRFPYTLLEGMSVFYPPVKSNISVFGLEGSTGCSVYDVDEKQLKSYSNKRVPDISQILNPSDPFETLKPGKAYATKCQNKAIVLFEGEDSGAFSKEVNNRGLTIVPTRAGMMGRRVFQLLKGCARASSARVQFFHIVSGNRNLNSKILSETMGYNDLISPGDAYIVYCDSTYQTAIWDPSEESFAENSAIQSSEYIYPEPKRLTSQDQYPHKYKGNTNMGQTYYYRYSKEFLK